MLRLHSVDSDGHIEDFNGDWAYPKVDLRQRLFLADASSMTRPASACPMVGSDAQSQSTLSRLLIVLSDQAPLLARNGEAARSGVAVYIAPEIAFSS